MGKNIVYLLVSPYQMLVNFMQCRHETDTSDLGSISEFQNGSYIIFTSAHYLHWCPLSSLVSIIFAGVLYLHWCPLSLLVSIIIASVQYCLLYRFLRLCKYQSFEGPCRFFLQVWVRVSRKSEVNTEFAQKYMVGWACVWTGFNRLSVLEIGGLCTW